eukprot:TRINITY_DN39888_c0_g1_i1.p1 TRINITY_DN39888_c0_g1~~TRINITY_DN39888_c0_g1_i1.p1  ORF type:complete len:147 (+),score=41.21 TRINITY_DN39888_c0_g1_i1:56-442(+)
MGGSQSSSAAEPPPPPVREPFPGVKVAVTKPGTGDKAAEGRFAMVHYTGKLADGTVFHSSRENDKPFEFALGEGRVIKCWDKGVATMSIGERATLTCAPEVAYGERGAGGVIPGGATLTFDVELLSQR